jgi:hypothetical protein
MPLSNKRTAEMGRPPEGERGLGGAAAEALFRLHVLELAGLEDLAALQALDELAPVSAGHHLNARMHTGAVRFVFLLGSAGVRRWQR